MSLTPMNGVSGDEWKKSYKREKYSMFSDKNRLRSLFVVYVSIGVLLSREVSLKKQH